MYWLILWPDSISLRRRVSTLFLPTISLSSSLLPLVASLPAEVDNDVAVAAVAAVVAVAVAAVAVVVVVVAAAVAAVVVDAHDSEREVSLGGIFLTDPLARASLLFNLGRGWWHGKKPSCQSAGFSSSSCHFNIND